MSDDKSEEVNARFEELQLLESEFEDVEDELIRKTNELNAPLYEKRAQLIAKIPHFWALVFENAPQEVDSYIQPSDSKVFAECLTTLEVERFEIHDPKGSPRSFSIKFGFSENEYFEDKVLEKKFWYRKGLDGWQGHVSEPVKIHWKKGQDLTEGLTDAAVKLWEAKKKLGTSSNGADAKAKETKLPEYKALASKIEDSEEASNSFFAWFGFVSSWKYITAEESEKATQKEKEDREKMKRGEKVEDDDDDEDEDNEHDFQETEVFPGGDELATIIVEEMWPGAIKYYKRILEEEDDEDLSELEFEEMDDDESDEEIDIRGLVGKGRKQGSSSPPSKKQRKA